MAQSYYGSICLTDLIAKAKELHPAYSKAQNGKVYVNINCWLNDTADKFGNVLSLVLSEKKENRADGKSFYIGNCKKSEYKEPTPISKNDSKEFDMVDDLPF